MLKKDDFELIGKLCRTHGVRGEIAARLDVDIASIAGGDEPLFLMVEEQGLLIPLRVASYRTKAGEIDLIKFDGIDSKTDAELWLGLPLWIDKRFLELDEWDGALPLSSRLVGYTVYNNEESLKAIGMIERVDDSTMNTLIYVRGSDDDELILPLAEELIVDVDLQKRMITLNIPQGLLDDSGVMV